MHRVVITSASKGCQSTQNCDGFGGLDDIESQMLASQLGNNWETPGK